MSSVKRKCNGIFFSTEEIKSPSCVDEKCFALMRITLTLSQNQTCVAKKSNNFVQ